jgi:hypothetical protein
MQSLVAQRDDNGWRVVLYHNTPAAFHGRPEASEAMTRNSGNAEACNVGGIVHGTVSW